MIGLGDGLVLMRLATEPDLLEDLNEPAETLTRQAGDYADGDGELRVNDAQQLLKDLEQP